MVGRFFFQWPRDFCVFVVFCSALTYILNLILVSSSFLFLVVRPLLLLAMHLFLVAYCF